MSGSNRDLNKEVAEKLARFKSIFIAYPPHIHLHDRLNYLQQLGCETRGLPQMGLRVIAQSGSGKSTAAEAYIASEAKRDLEEGRVHRIIKADLQSYSTPKKLMTTILDKFGDPYASYGNELALKRRVFKCFEQFRTELLIVDEVQHLNYRNGVKNDVTDLLKGMLDTGVVPIVFLGTEDAAPMFARNLQLNGRLLAPCNLPPLDASRSEDRNLFARFVRNLEDVVVEQRILPETSSFEQDDLLPSLFEVSAGVIGRTSRVIQAALEVAIRRQAPRMDSTDLSWAFDNWAVEQSFVTHNPLKRG